jgi:hypothetical protein
MRLATTATLSISRLARAVTVIHMKLANSVLVSAISIASLSLGLGGCSSNDDGPPAWRATDIDAADAYYSGVWGSSSDDVFVVGGVQRGTIQHFDGDEWTTMEIPQGTPPLVWVFGFSAADVYAVGEMGTFLHYDGSSWAELDSNTSKTLWGIWGTGPEDLWLVGGSAFDGRPTIRHWTGQESEVHELDEVALGDNVHALFKVWGHGSDVYAVGQAGTILRYSGGAWASIPTGESSQDFIALWGTDDSDLVAVGGRGQGRIATFDGSAFDTSTPEGTGGVSAVFVCPDRIIVGGDPGFVGSYDRDSASIDIEYNALTPVHAIWSDCNGTTYAVGGLFVNPPANAVAAVEN